MATKLKPVIFVRSILDLGDFNDDEVNNEPSLTDPSQDEPIEALVARMMRGELVGGAEPSFDTDSDLSPVDVFARQSVTTKDGFDLADAPAIQKRAEAALSVLSVPPPTPAPVPASTVAPQPVPDAK